MRQVCQVEAWLRLGRDVVGMQVEVLEVWQVWVWAWGCRKLRCGMRLGTWRCGRLGPPATRGRSNLPHVAAPPATCGRSTCHTKKGCSATLKRIHLPPRIVPQPFPRSPAPALPTPPYQTPKPSHQPFPTTLPQPANYLPKLPLTLQFSKVE